MTDPAPTPLQFAHWLVEASRLEQQEEAGLKLALIAKLAYAAGVAAGTAAERKACVEWVALSGLDKWGAAAGKLRQDREAGL